jgi:hypothetical protein
MEKAGYQVTDDTKGCLHCGQSFEAKRESMIFCSDQCKTAFHKLQPGARFINPPIVIRGSLKHNDLYTSGDTIQLKNGILRLKVRYQDPAKRVQDEVKHQEVATWAKKVAERRGI